MEGCNVSTFNVSQKDLQVKGNTKWQNNIAIKLVTLQYMFTAELEWYDAYLPSTEKVEISSYGPVPYL